MADSNDTDAVRDTRSDRGDAALVAQYIHEISERHGGSGDPDVLEPDGEGLDDGV
jgi:hypothetical protein